MIKAIIIDFDGVVVNTIDPYLFIKFSKISHKNWRDIKSKTMPFWIKSATSRVDEEKWWNSLEQVCDIGKDRLKKISYSFCKVNREIIDLIKKLKRKYIIILFSNHIPKWFNYLIRSNNLKKNFDLIITSFDEKIYKSNKKIYFRILKKIKAKPQECVFIDNKKENITLAKETGLQVILYKNANVLKNKLRSLDYD